MHAITTKLVLIFLDIKEKERNKKESMKKNKNCVFTAIIIIKIKNFDRRL